MDRKQKRKRDEPRRPRRDEQRQRHAHRSDAATNHHDGDQASVAGETSVTRHRPPSNHDDAGGLPPSTTTHYTSQSYSSSYWYPPPPPHHHHHHERGHASNAHRGASDLPTAEDASFTEHQSVARASYSSTANYRSSEAVSSVARRHHSQDEARHHQGDEASLTSFVSDTAPSVAQAISSTGSTSRHSSGRHLADAGDFKPSARRLDNAGTGTTPPYASMYHSTYQDAPSNVAEEASFAEQRSVTGAPAGFMGDPMGVAHGSRNRTQDDGEPKPMGPGIIPLLGDSIARNEEEEHPPPSIPDVELVHANEVGTHSADDAVAEEVFEEVDEEVHPGAIAVAGPGGPPRASGAPASHQQPEEDADNRTVEVQVRAELVGVEDPLRVLQALEERMDRMEINQQNRPPVVVAESMPIQVQPVPDDSPVDHARVDNPLHLQQQSDPNDGMFHWFKSKKSRILVGIAFLVLVIVVIILGVSRGRSSSGGGSSDASQPTATGGPAASPPPSDEPVATDTPAPEATASPEATLNPTDPGTEPTASPDATPDPTLSPTLAPATPDPTLASSQPLTPAPSPTAEPALNTDTPTLATSPEATPDPTPPPTLEPATPDPTLHSTPPPTPNPTPPPLPNPTPPPTPNPTPPFTPNATPPPTLPPTPPPTFSPVSPTRELIQTVSVALNGGAALQNASSPQSLALEWLEGNANLPTYSNTQKIQRFALASLYHSTNGVQWDGDNLGWLSDDPECEWGSNYPTLCTAGQLINRLWLYDDNLSGSIPPELALLSNSLDHLELDNNNIGGSIPSELGLLSNLELMWLYSNDITGRIPTEVGLLSKMTWLSLDNNALTGVIPTVFKSMTNLDRLYLYGNDFTGEFECPDFIEYCYISCLDPGDHNATSPCRSL